LERENRRVFRLDNDGYKFPEEKPLVVALIDRALEVDETSFRHQRPDALSGFRL